MHPMRRASSQKPAQPGLRVIVCGGRDYADKRHIFAVLDSIHRAKIIGKLIHGMAPGADRIAGLWAIARCFDAVAGSPVVVKS